MLEINPTLGKLLDDFDALVGVGPPDAQFVLAGAERPHLFGGVIRELDDAELVAVGIKFVDEFGGDFDLSAVIIKFPALAEAAGR